MRAEGSPKELGPDVFVRNAQLVEFPARLAKLELERVQLTLIAARGRRRGNGPVAFSGKTSSPPPPPPRRPAERGKCLPPCTFQGPFRGKRESSPESAELPRNRGKHLPLRNTWSENGGTVTFQTRDIFPSYPLQCTVTVVVGSEYGKSDHGIASTTAAIATTAIATALQKALPGRVARRAARVRAARAEHFVEHPPAQLAPA